MAEQLIWFKKWDKVLVEDFKEGKHKWFVSGKLNVSHNCLDRHLKSGRGNKAALIWEGDIGDSHTLTYQELYYHVCKFANVLKKHGVKKGDRVTIYLPMILELPIAMLACARIGAVHSVVFGGFSADALRDRILDCDSKLLICADGYYWLMGRIDDVILVSGHRIGTAEVESALVSHPQVAEAAVVGMPHEVKGQGIYAFVTLKVGVEKSNALKKELIAHVRKEIGPIASPDKIQFADRLPKTRSGKIMRRILTRIAAGNTKELGDTSTLADPSVVPSLVKGSQQGNQ